MKTRIDAEKETDHTAVCSLAVSCAGGPPAERKQTAPQPPVINIGKLLDSTCDTFVFREQFTAILTRLIDSSWDESGNWKGDLQGDATVFAPMILYALGRDSGSRELTAMADKTVAYEAGLVKRCLVWPVPSMNMVIGFPALVQPYLQTGDPRYLSMFFSGVRIGSACISLFPGFFTPFVRDKASAFGLIGYMNLTAAQASGDNTQKDAFIHKGISLIEKANSRCWDEGESLYRYSSLMDWPQQTMMMALIKAYGVTGDKKYLDQALLVFDTLDRRCRDTIRGGYSGHPDPDTKGLSGNNNMAWILLDLHEATGDKRYLEEAESLLGWILSEDLYDREKGLVCHHYTKQSGRADYYCTGCNFNTLTCIYRLNTSLEKTRASR